MLTIKVQKTLKNQEAANNKFHLAILQNIQSKISYILGMTIPLYAAIKQTNHGYQTSKPRKNKPK